MNEEMLAKLQKARTVEEIIAIAKEYGKEVTAEKAQELLDKLNSAAGELSDDALAAVAGGMGFYEYQDIVRELYQEYSAGKMSDQDIVRELYQKFGK